MTQEPYNLTAIREQSDAPTIILTIIILIITFIYSLLEKI